MDSFRKAYGALKDSTKVGLAKVNSEFKDLDIAIVKATNHVEYPPKERHVRKLLHATTYARPRTDIAYCIHALGKRLTKTRNWIVAIKTLIVIHRMLREGDATFMEELLNYSNRGYLFQLSNFKDESSPLAWDCSAWVRTYGLFLEERLECFRVIKYDIESERMSKAQFGTSKMYSRTRLLDREDLLEQLPALQQLLFRLIGCRPGGARYNFLVQYALALVLKESFKIYCAINDGIITLVDMFFDMSKHDAIKALNIYKKAGQQAENLAEFYDICRGLDLARTFQFPILRQPPPSFLATMEEYIREAPHVGSISNRMLEYQETDQEIHKFKEQEEPFEEAIPEVKEEEEEKKEETETETEEAQSEDAIEGDSINTTPALVSPQDQPTDLLGLNEINPKAMELDESNALALAIPKPGDDPLSTDKNLSEISNTSGWEVALVTAKSSSSHNNNIQSMDAKMAGGFNKLLLDSLYEDDTARRQIQLQNAGYNSSYGYNNMPIRQQNPFNQIDDPFAMSNNIPPPTNVQMALMSHQHHHHQQQSQQYHHNMMMTAPATPPPYDPYGGTHYPQQQQQMPFSATPPPTNNPFGDPFTHHPQNSMSSPGNNTLI